ncbi:hypothetical protein MPEAHAMD_5672 [Methylobacterium frigidaeris]|uniref:Uncharacterized protein n=1 Tax=Methylobacterium frigidaeris TaxID=2038277 RepID=A0AA37HH64_9HYPH|nr:hypothetical protein MPEAHAMD_5672 [Methylobacterium frigidaeris]
MGGRETDRRAARPGLWRIWPLRVRLRLPPLRLRSCRGRGRGGCRVCSHRRGQWQRLRRLRLFRRVCGRLPSLLRRRPPMTRRAQSSARMGDDPHERGSFLDTLPHGRMATPHGRMTTKGNPNLRSRLARVIRHGQPEADGDHPTAEEGRGPFGLAAVRKGLVDAGRESHDDDCLSRLPRARRREHDSALRPRREGRWRSARARRRWLAPSIHSRVAHSTASKQCHGPRRWIARALNRPLIVPAGAAVVDPHKLVGHGVEGA